MRRAILAAVAVAVALGACGKRERILPGVRLDTRALDGGASGTPANTVRAVAIPGAVSNGDWTHVGGGPEHRIPNVALAAPLAPLFAAPIGAGEDRRHRITADPVVAGGRVFTLDAEATVAAHDLGGAPLWSRDLTPGADNASDASGGGLATAGGRVYATSAFGELVALDAATGGLVWRQRLPAPVTGSPTVADGTVYVVAEDSSGWAVDAATGKVRWSVPGTPSPSSVVGGPGPTVAGRLALLPYPSGQIAAVLRESGVPVWTGDVLGRRLGEVYATVTGITADPVVVGPTVYAGNPTGRVVALDTATGEARWTAAEGALNPVVVAGGAVFLVSDRAELVRLDAGSGARVWGVQLPDFVDPRPRKRKAVYAHYGPVLAGGRLLVASTDGALRAFDPASGRLLEQVPLGAPAATAPAVANGILYVVTADGRLRGFR